MKFPLFKVHVPIEAALKNIENVFGQGFINEGTQVTELTLGLQKKLNAKNLLLVNSCTSALTLALKLAGVEPGDDVISTPMTCVATNTPIVAAGANIVWADVDPYDGMITAADVEKRITAKTKAVIAVAWAGNPPNLGALQALCRKHSIKLILDAAHAFAAQYNSAPVHASADYTCYSFQAIKHFTTGDGGALVVNDDEQFARAKALKWFGLDRDRAKDAKGDWKGQQWDVDIEEAGYKFNMNNVSAAIGLAQLPHIDGIIDTHRKNALQYVICFGDNAAIGMTTHAMDWRSSHWVFTVTIDQQHSKLSRDELLKALNDDGIQAGVVHVPNDNYTAFERFKADLPGVRHFSRTQLSLPCGWWLQSQDIVHIANRVKELVG